MNLANYFNTFQKLKTRIRRVRHILIIFYLHHDIARLHRSKKTRDQIDRVNFKIVPRPPNSTNLAPNDFHLFPILKESILGIKFDSDEEEVQFAVLTWLRNQSKEFYNIGFHTWIHRLETCISINGDCVKNILTEL